MKKPVIDLLTKTFNKKGIKMKKEEIETLLEIPPSEELGDYAFPCFSLTKQLQMSPEEIALKLRESIGNPPVLDFDGVQTSGGYLNFFLNRKNLARKVVWEVITQKSKYGTSKFGRKRKMIIEFSSPNIAKPFGIGHLRSTIIGNSIANICNFIGFKTIRINYLGDWGTQFGRLIFGFQKFGDEEKLQKDPIQHLLNVYVRTNKKIYDEPAREWFKKLEENNKEAVVLWRAFKELSLEDFEKIYKCLEIKFDFWEGESNYNKHSEKVLKLLEKKKLLKKSKGAMIVDLNKHNLGVLLIKKSDGTTLYATRDIAAAIMRHRKHNFDGMIYEVGQEQKLYFKQLFKVLELMGYKWVTGCKHVSHGLYLDKDGKRFATRKGKTVLMENILDKTIAIAKKELKKRNTKLSKEKLEERALKIAKGAIFYGDLKNNRTNDVLFDIGKFVSFEGDTGPYLQYSYARASSILRKTKNQDKFSIEELESKEIELIKKISTFPDVILNSYQHLNPSFIANYSYQLAKIFNEFYHCCPVIGSKQESFRLALVESFRQVLKNSLDLLGINVLEEM